MCTMPTAFMVSWAWVIPTLKCGVMMSAMPNGILLYSIHNLNHRGDNFKKGGSDAPLNTGPSTGIKKIAN